MDTHELKSMLEEAGHLHLFLDSGAEAKVSKHDTTIKASGTIVIDSREGHWTISTDKVEYADKEPSELERAE